MSRTVSILSRSLFALGFVIGALQSCGSSGSGGDATAVCNQQCNKAYSCENDGGTGTSTSMAQCMAVCMQTCSNKDQLLSAANACIAMPACADFTACIAAPTFPKCQSAGGTDGSGSGGAGAAMGGISGGGAGRNGGGGSTGAGGTTGTGGSGTASCSTCTKAETCCIAEAQLIGTDAGACGLSSAQCNATQAGTAQNAYIQTCTLTLTTGAGAGLAACQ
ncbi:MAG TPA: hypothetical protein VIK30_12975 [Polyangia bacterium]